MSLISTLSKDDETRPAWLARNNAAPTAPNGRWGQFHDGYDLASEATEVRWRKSYPFQLVVLTKGQDGYEIVKDDTSKKALQFTLPVPPEALTVTTPFATSGSVTWGGYVEVNGGAPLKIISIVGTTGVLPTRAHTDTLGDTSLAKALFAGIVSAGTGLGAKVAKLTGKTPPKGNVYGASDAASTFPTQFSQLATDASRPLSKSTGYYQMRLLERFLDGYVYLKTTAKGRDYRLAFANWKDEAIYLVTPTAFSVKRSADSPLERRYDLQLKAFARIPLDLKTSAVRQAEVSGRKANDFARMLTKIQEVRGILQSGTALVRALGADVQNVVFDTLREVALGLKDAIGVAQSVVDFPQNLIKEAKGTVLNEFVSVAGALNHLKSSVSHPSTDFNDDVETIRQATKEQANHPQGRVTSSGHPFNEIFDNPTAHRDVLDALHPSSFRFPEGVQAKFDAERERVRNLGRADYEQRRDGLVTVLSDYADAVGAGHPTYNAMTGRASRNSLRTTPTDGDYQILDALNEAVIELSRLAAYTELSPIHVRTPMEVIAGYAEQSGIAFSKNQAKMAVPFMYGHTLEQLAQIYLGDPNRWYEIAALNGLREPYVDEAGFSLPFLANPYGNTLSVSDGSMLIPGQAVWLEATGLATSKRYVVTSQKVYDGYWNVTVDGDPADAYTVALSGQIQSYRPHTVNSQQMLFIPTDQAVDQDPRERAVPGVKDLDHLLAVGGIDLLLSPTNDLVLTPDGDGRWAYGMSNILQQARIIISTTKGTLLHEPDFGCGLQIGQSTADLSAKGILEAAQQAFSSDPTYTGVQSASVLLKGPVAQLILGVGIAGQSQAIPIAVDVPR